MAFFLSKTVFMLLGCFCFSCSMMSMKEAAKKNFIANIEAHDFDAVRAAIEGGYMNDVDCFEGYLISGTLKRKVPLYGADYLAFERIEKYLVSLSPDTLREYQINAQAPASSAQSSSASVSMEFSASASASVAQISSTASLMDSRFKTPLEDILRDVLGSPSTQAFGPSSSQTIPLSQPQSSSTHEVINNTGHVENAQQENSGLTEQSPTIFAQPYIEAQTINRCRHCANWCVATLWMIFMLLLPQRCQ